MSIEDMAARHGRACEGFTKVVEAVGDGDWDRPSPCTEWDARGVVEHVIGSHDVLILRPLDAKPSRPKDDVRQRWAVTASALREALARPDASDHGVDLGSLVPVMTADVLIHTWDLARATGVVPDLDPELCEASYAMMEKNADKLAGSGMFGERVPVPDDADGATKLVALSGRDPAWQPPTA